MDYVEATALEIPELSTRKQKQHHSIPFQWNETTTTINIPVLADDGCSTINLTKNNIIVVTRNDKIIFKGI